MSYQSMHHHFNNERSGFQQQTTTISSMNNRTRPGVDSYTRPNDLSMAAPIHTIPSSIQHGYEKGNVLGKTNGPHDASIISSSATATTTANGQSIERGIHTSPGAAYMQSPSLFNKVSLLDAHIADGTVVPLDKLELLSAQSLSFYKNFESMRVRLEQLCKEAAEMSKYAVSKEQKINASKKRQQANSFYDDVLSAQNQISTIFNKIAGASKKSDANSGKEIVNSGAITSYPNRDIVLKIIQQNKIMAPLPQPVLTRREKALSDAIKRNELYTPNELLCFFEVFSFLDCRDLVISSMVCKSWRNIISNNDAWKATVMNYETTLHGHVGKINAIARISKYLFTGSSDGKVKAWDTTTWSCMKTLNLNKYPNPNEIHSSQQLQKTEQTSASGVGGVQPFSPAVASPMQPMSPTSALSHPNHTASNKYGPVAVTSLAAHGLTLFIGLDSGKVICQNVIDTSKGNNQNKKVHELLIGHEGAINAIVIDAKRNLILTASSDHRIGVWDLVKKTFISFIKKHVDVVSCLAISNDYLFSGSWDHNIHVWDLNTLQHKAMLGENSHDFDRNIFLGDEYGGRSTTNNKHTDRVLSIVYHDNRLYSSSWDCFIKIWDIPTMALMRQVTLNPISICWCLGLRDVGGKKYLVGGVRENDVFEMDLKTFFGVTYIQKNSWGYKPDLHKDQVVSIYAIDDGRIVTGSGDWTAKVWGSKKLEKMANAIPLSIIKPLLPKPSTTYSTTPYSAALTVGSVDSTSSTPEYHAHKDTPTDTNEIASPSQSLITPKNANINTVDNTNSKSSNNDQYYILGNNDNGNDQFSLLLDPFSDNQGFDESESIMRPLNQAFSHSDSKRIRMT